MLLHLLPRQTSNASKHYGIQPNRDECVRLFVVAREFFDEVSLAHLGGGFAVISTIDLLTVGEPKGFLCEARDALAAGDFEKCAIRCRMALYLELEQHYDISNYETEATLGLLDGACYAPSYAKSREYVAKYVNDPTDFIVFDHNYLNQTLLTNGADNTSFWNVWRMTPDVFRRRSGEWVVKHDYSKLDKEVLGASIEYIFHATLDIVLAIHRTRTQQKTPIHTPYNIELKRGGVNVYKKADRTSEIIGQTPDDNTRFYIQYRVEGLRNDGAYWCFMYPVPVKGYISGFVHNDDLAQPE